VCGTSDPRFEANATVGPAQTGTMIIQPFTLGAMLVFGLFVFTRLLFFLRARARAAQCARLPTVDEKALVSLWTCTLNYVY
jgi:hypothetical protein